jgi:hypothetical protein
MAEQEGALKAALEDLKEALFYVQPTGEGV